MQAIGNDFISFLFGHFLDSDTQNTGAESIMFVK